ncbi:MAG TPA: hypothetical protein VFM88_19060 [Vicinamibacteria bacterium]|nr:hypothetical protein [Vicinamibacteria bacterium]
MEPAPSPAAIRSLRPNLTQAQAIARFEGGLLRLPRWLGGAPLRSVADAYLPFHVYEVEVTSSARPYVTWLAVDAVDGSLDPFQFDRAPSPDELALVETRNRPVATLAESEAARLLEDKLRRIVYQTGFFRARRLSFRATRVPLDLHVPYWLGFYEQGGGVRLRVLDAVRRRFEGGRARALFTSWIAG